ncbi:MAG: glutamyl-tRNA reductase [Candidatus Margulisiibacteriota bacterium]
MRLAVISLNYTNTPIDLLERCSCNIDQVTSYLSDTIGTLFFNEMVIISTCNRTEWVFTAPDIDKAIDVLFEKVKEKALISTSILKKHADVYKGVNAISHLFQVVCGLKSMVLGENEILTQVKESYAISMEFGATAAHLNKFFQLLIATGKEARSVTKISSGAHSISSIAIEALKEQYPDFIHKPLLLIGAGVMIQRAIAKLTSMGHNQLWIANRTMSKAEAIANIHSNISVIPFASIKQKLAEFSSVYIGIHSKNYIFTNNDFQYLHGNRIIVDVSLPRCVDPRCEELPNIDVISVNKLEAIANQTIQTRESVIPHVHSVIRVAMSEFNDWLSYRDESYEWVNERFQADQLLGAR